jgi:hypothetical protein
MTKDFYIDDTTQALTGGVVTYNGRQGRIWEKRKLERNCWVFQCRKFFPLRTTRKEIVAEL